MLTIEQFNKKLEDAIKSLKAEEEKTYKALSEFAPYEKQSKKYQNLFDKTLNIGTLITELMVHQEAIENFEANKKEHLLLEQDPDLKNDKQSQLFLREAKRVLDEQASDLTNNLNNDCFSLLKKADTIIDLNNDPGRQSPKHPGPK